MAAARSLADAEPLFLAASPVGPPSFLLAGLPPAAETPAFTEGGTSFKAFSPLPGDRRRLEAADPPNSEDEAASMGALQSAVQDSAPETLPPVEDEDLGPVGSEENSSWREDTEALINAETALPPPRLTHRSVFRELSRAIPAAVILLLIISAFFAERHIRSLAKKTAKGTPTIPREEVAPPPPRPGELPPPQVEAEVSSSRSSPSLSLSLSLSDTLAEGASPTSSVGGDAEDSEEDSGRLTASPSKGVVEEDRQTPQHASEAEEEEEEEAGFAAPITEGAVGGEDQAGLQQAAEAEEGKEEERGTPPVSEGAVGGVEGTQQNSDRETGEEEGRVFRSASVVDPGARPKIRVAPPSKPPRSQRRRSQIEPPLPEAPEPAVKPKERTEVAKEKKEKKEKGGKSSPEKKKRLSFSTKWWKSKK